MKRAPEEASPTRTGVASSSATVASSRAAKTCPSSQRVHTNVYSLPDHVIVGSMKGCLPTPITFNTPVLPSASIEVQTFDLREFVSGPIPPVLTNSRNDDPFDAIATEPIEPARGIGRDSRNAPSASRIRNVPCNGNGPYSYAIRYRSPLEATDIKPSPAFGMTCSAPRGAPSGASSRKRSHDDAKDTVWPVV